MSDFKKEIAENFQKYCSRCGGLCCKQGDATFFAWEFKKLPEEKTRNSQIRFKDYWKRFRKNVNIKRVNLNGLCPFLTGSECGLGHKFKPIDCVTYPIYPEVKFSGKNDKCIEGFFVHKSCPFFKEIASDDKLLDLVSKLWSGEINMMNNREIKKWFGEKRNYWLDYNLFKIKK